MSGVLGLTVDVLITRKNDTVASALYQRF